MLLRSLAVFFRRSPKDLFAFKSHDMTSSANGNATLLKRTPPPQHYVRVMVREENPALFVSHHFMESQPIRNCVCAKMFQIFACLHKTATETKLLLISPFGLVRRY